ncbi:MAG TPA: helix-turn-helix domain-containing protein, partial [Pseudolabrys sp.]|nr:helix-turn-helix domain-containing protein [Pseudolabrys sp.]
MRTNLGLDERTTTAPAPRRTVTGLNVPAPRAKGHAQKLGATARSFAILEHVAGSPTPVDVFDIIAKLKLPKATAYRLVDWF